MKSFQKWAIWKRSAPWQFFHSLSLWASVDQSNTGPRAKWKTWAFTNCGEVPRFLLTQLGSFLWCSSIRFFQCQSLPGYNTSSHKLFWKATWTTRGPSYASLSPSPKWFLGKTGFPRIWLGNARELPAQEVVCYPWAAQVLSLPATTEIPLDPWVPKACNQHTVSHLFYAKSTKFFSL